MGQTAANTLTRAHFEIHVLYGDRWVIDYVSTSREEALEEAEDLLRRPEIAGVRVVKELFNPVTETTAARILFEQRRPTGPAGRRGRLRFAVPRPAVAREAPPVAGASAPPSVTEDPEEAFSWLSLAGLSLVGAVVGGGLTVVLALVAGP